MSNLCFCREPAGNSCTIVFEACCMKTEPGKERTQCGSMAGAGKFDFCMHSLFVVAWLCHIPCHSAATIKHRTGPSSKQGHKGKQGIKQAGTRASKQASQQAGKQQASKQASKQQTNKQSQLSSRQASKACTVKRNSFLTGLAADLEQLEC